MKHIFNKTLLLKTMLLSALCASGFYSPLVQADSSIPVADFFKKTSFSGRPVLSPDGKNILMLTPRNGRFVLTVIELATRKAKVIASDPVYDLTDIAWINNRRVSFSVTKGGDVTAAENDGGGLFAVDIDGGNFRTLVVTAKDAQAGKEYKPYSIVKTVGDDSNDLIVMNNARGRSVELGASDLYRLDSLTGRTSLLTFKNPGKVGSWLLDHNNVIRLASRNEVDAGNKRIKQTVFYRDTADAEWKTIYSAYHDEGKAMNLVAFDFDNKTLFVSGRFHGRDTEAIHIWDFEKQTAGEIIAEAPGVDVSQLIQDRRQKKTIAAVVPGMKTELIYFDQQYAKIQASLNASFPDQDVYFSLREHAAVVSTTGVNNVGSVYFFDTDKKSLEPIYVVKPELEAKNLSAQTVIKYAARDGLTIPAYLTLPEGKAARALPLIAYIHGGPHARDQFGFDPITQMFASRGYAVLQPQFRMSTGFGWKHHTAGWKQWGLAMQDDITDGVDFLVKQGIVDKERICIIGASYGGYATMYGLIKTPDLYKCGVNFVGVTDVKMLFTVNWSDGSPAVMENIGALMHGDPKTDEAYFQKVSAIGNADKIKAPVLMAYGSEDFRVPLIHGEKMRDKLLAQGKTVEWMVMVGEAHGWSKESNNIKWGETMLKFVDRYIGASAVFGATAETSARK